MTDEDREYLGAMERRFYAALEHVETSLLTEFHKWASPFEVRQRSHSAAIRALDVESERVSDVLKEVETRLKALEEGK